MKNRLLFLTHLVIIICSLSVQIYCDNSNEDDIFIPTQEWKTIKKGQKIPKGLHIRINLETGLKEAKLLDKDEISPSSSLSIVRGDIDSHKEEDGSMKMDPAKLKVQLNKIKAEKMADPSDDDVKKKYRTYEELKKEMKEINLNPQTDSEIMNQLFDEYDEEMKNEDAEEDKLLRIIADLDYLAHQYDNALDFIKFDGFRKIILKNLNSTNNSIKSESLKLFSSLVQNNGQAKVHALEVGSIPILLRILNLGQSGEVKLRATTALGCLLRSFPYAQINFIENGGLATFSEIFELDHTKINVKMATIINDFLVERQNDKKHFEAFKRIDLEEMLIKVNWCEHLTDLLYALVYSNADDHDSVEKVLVAMYSMPEQCHEFYDKDVIKYLKAQYKFLVDSDPENDYLESLAQFCDSLLQKLGDYPKIKTEL